MSHTPRNTPPAGYDADPSDDRNWFAADTNTANQGEVIDPRTAEGFVVNPDKPLADMGITAPRGTARDYPENWLEQELDAGGAYADAQSHGGFSVTEPVKTRTPSITETGDLTLLPVENLPSREDMRRKRPQPANRSPAAIKSTAGTGWSRAGSDQ